MNLLGTRSTQRYRGMVNAVLRRADREREDFLAILSAQPTLPHWLAARWREQWGEAAVVAFDALARGRGTGLTFVWSTPAPKRPMAPKLCPPVNSVSAKDSPRFRTVRLGKMGVGGCRI